MSPEETIRTLVQAAYEHGWRDACSDHIAQGISPDYPIGRGKRGGSIDVLQHLDPNDLLGLQGGPKWS